MDYLVEQLRYQLREEPSSRVFFKLGELLRREGELDEAVAVLRAGIEHHPRYVAAWVSLGRALLESGSGAAAAMALAHALELDPENAVAARIAGEAAIANGEWVEAIKALKRARALSGQDDVLDERILFVESHLADLGQLEVPDPGARRPRPVPEPSSQAADEGVFPVEDTAGGADSEEDDVFETAAANGDDDVATDMDSRRTMAIPLDQVLVPPPPDTREAPSAPDVPSDAVFDLGADEAPEPEAEPVFEPRQGIEPDAVFEAVPEAPPDDDMAASVDRPEPETEADAVFEPGVGTVDHADRPAPGALEASPEAAAVFDLEASNEPKAAAESAPSRGDDDESLEHLPDHEQRSEELPLPTMTLARLALDQGDLELAERTLRGVLARHPGHLEASRLLASLTEGAAETESRGSGATGTTGDARVQALRRWLDAVRLASERLKS